MKKLPNKITTEDLLAALENPETTDTKEVLEIFDFINDVPLFLDKYKIEAGENPVSKRSLYRLYLQFSESKVNSLAFGQAITQFVNFNNTNYFINLTRKEVTALLHAKNIKPSRYNIASIGTREHFQQFLEENEIRAGDKWVEGYILYYIYKKWCRQKRKIIRFKHNPFMTMLKLHLPNKRTMHYGCWIRVDQAIMEKLSYEDIGNIMQERKEANEEYKTRKKEQSKKS